MSFCSLASEIKLIKRSGVAFVVQSLHGKVRGEICGLLSCWCGIGSILRCKIAI